MGDFPGRPKVTKGALLVFGATLPVPTQVIVFPLNPDSVNRQFNLGQGAAAKAPPGSAETVTPATAPIETLSVSLALDAADQLEHPSANPVTVVSGLLPVLSAIEQLLYPSTVLEKLRSALAQVGLSTITPAIQPWTVFVWGAGRIVPVKVSGLTITEQAFDPRLNPITAKADLQLTLLTANDVAKAPMVIQKLVDLHAAAREAFSIVNTAQSAAHAPSVLPI